MCRIILPLFSFVKHFFQKNSHIFFLPHDGSFFAIIIRYNNTFSFTFMLKTTKMPLLLSCFTSKKTILNLGLTKVQGCVIIHEMSKGVHLDRKTMSEWALFFFRKGLKLYVRRSGSYPLRLCHFGRHLKGWEKNDRRKYC